MGSHGGGPFVLEDPHPREAVRMLENEGIKVLTLEEVVDELIQSIEEEMKEYEKERTGRVGKLEDPVMALLRELVRKNSIQIIRINGIRGFNLRLEMSTGITVNGEKERDLLEPSRYSSIFPGIRYNGAFPSFLTSRVSSSRSSEEWEALKRTSFILICAFPLT